MLRYRADVRPLAFVASYFVLFAFLWLKWEDLGALRWLLLVMLCVWSWTCAVITHNVVHATLWRSRFLNKMTQVLLTLAYGYPVSEYVPGHNLSHHRYAQTRRDTMRTTKIDTGWNLLNLLLFFPRVAIDVYQVTFRYNLLMRKHHTRWFRQLQLELICTWSVKIAFLAIDWRKALLLVFVPHLYAAIGIVAVNYLQHDGCDTDHPYNHSRNFVGRFFNWFTFNNGYHGMHHMQPGLHWSLLPQAHAERLQPFMDPRLDEPSMALYLWRAFVWPGKRVRYDGKPVVIDEGPDEDWIPLPRDIPADISLGAEAMPVATTETGT